MGTVLLLDSISKGRGLMSVGPPPQSSLHFPPLPLVLESGENVNFSRRIMKRYEYGATHELPCRLAAGPGANSPHVRSGFIFWGLQRANGRLAIVLKGRYDTPRITPQAKQYHIVKADKRRIE